MCIECCGTVHTVVWPKTGCPVHVGVTLTWNMVWMAPLGVLPPRARLRGEHQCQRDLVASSASSPLHFHKGESAHSSVLQRTTMTFLTWILCISPGSSLAIPHWHWGPLCACLFVLPFPQWVRFFSKTTKPSFVCLPSPRISFSSLIPSVSDFSRNQPWHQLVLLAEVTETQTQLV